MVRRGRVDDAFHECAAIARLAIPAVGEEIAVRERARQIVVIQHRQAVAHAVDALEEHPATRAGLLERLAQRLDFGLGHLIARFEVRLDHAMAAARRKPVAARRKRRRDIRGDTEGLDADAVRKLVRVLRGVGVRCGDRVQRRHGIGHAVLLEPLGE